MAIDWEEKFSVVVEAILDILLEGLLLAIWILVTYGLTLLVKVTVGLKWQEIEELIRGIALLIVSVVGVLEVIISISIRTCYRLQREIRRDKQRKT